MKTITIDHRSNLNKRKTICRTAHNGDVVLLIVYCRWRVAVFIVASYCHYYYCWYLYFYNFFFSRLAADGKEYCDWFFGNFFRLTVTMSFSVPSVELRVLRVMKETECLLHMRKLKEEAVEKIALAIPQPITRSKANQLLKSHRKDNSGKTPFSITKSTCSHFLLK